MTCPLAETKLNKPLPQMNQHQNEGNTSCQAWYLCAISTQFPEKSTDRIPMRPRHSMAKEYSLMRWIWHPSHTEVPRRLQNLMERSPEDISRKQKSVKCLWPKWTFGGCKPHVPFLQSHLGRSCVSCLGLAWLLPLQSCLFQEASSA